MYLTWLPGYKTYNKHKVVGLCEASKAPGCHFDYYVVSATPACPGIRGNPERKATLDGPGIVPFTHQPGITELAKTWGYCPDLEVLVWPSWLQAL